MMKKLISLIGAHWLTPLERESMLKFYQLMP